MYSLIDTLDLAADDIQCSVAYILFSRSVGYSGSWNSTLWKTKSVDVRVGATLKTGGGGGIFGSRLSGVFFYKRRIGVLRELRDSFTVREDAVPYYRLMRYMFAVLIVHSICIEGSCSVLSCPTC